MLMIVGNLNKEMPKATYKLILSHSRMEWLL